MGLLYLLLTLSLIIIIIIITWVFFWGDFHSYHGKSFSSPHKHVKKVLSN